MASPTNVLEFRSPHEGSSKNISSNQSPGSNPFDDLLKVTNSLELGLEFENSPFSPYKSFKDTSRPSLAPLDLNSSDFLARESLGILPNTALTRDSLTSDLFNLSFRETSDVSPRESLGVLNISAMDLGRESIGIFNIQNSFVRKKSDGKEIQGNFAFNLDNFSCDDIENGLQAVKKSPVQKDNPIPEILLSTSSTQEKTNSLSRSGFNDAFLLPHSRILSAASSGSSGKSWLTLDSFFNNRSLEEISKICSGGSSHKDLEISSLLTKTDPFNEAFQISTNVKNDKHSVSQVVTSTNSKSSFESDIENIRKRVQSLPVAFEDNIVKDIEMKEKVSSLSFLSDMVCRGIRDEKEFDDSVFLEAKKVADIIADSSFVGEDKSFDSKEHNILDSTPQPVWPTELDSSHSNIEEIVKSPKYGAETVLKQVDKMLGMQPVNLEEKLNMKNSSKDDSPSLQSVSQNISKISTTSQGSVGENQSCTNISQNLSRISKVSGNAGNQSSASNNFSQNLSKITQTSEENVSRLIQNLSDILKENENLSKSQKHEGQQMLRNLAELLCDNKNKASSCEDSGHSSVEDHHLEENKDTKIGNKTDHKVADNAGSNNSEEICQALDLSLKSKSFNNDVNRMVSTSKTSARSRDQAPYLVKTPNRLVPTNLTNSSIASNCSDMTRNSGKGNYSNASSNQSKSSNLSHNASAGRHSNISQNRVSFSAGKLRKSKVGVVVAKKGPLRAVLPVENMAKVPKSAVKTHEVQVTPERSNGGLKVGMKSKTTSTPIQEPKLKPMAASTPAMRQSKEAKDNLVSPLARPKFHRSVSYQPKTSTTLENPKNTGISKTAVNKPLAKLEVTKPVRRNSISEEPSNVQKDSEGPMRIKRSFSTGKEPKIFSALSRVRQNILNSPYYNPRKSLGSLSGDKKVDVLREKTVQSGMDLKGHPFQEIKRLSAISHPKKPGKENLKP